MTTNIVTVVGALEGEKRLSTNTDEFGSGDSLSHSWFSGDKNGVRNTAVLTMRKTRTGRVRAA